MNKPLWQPSKKLKDNSLLRDFCKFINFKSSNNFKEIWQWSIDNPNEFWSKFWDYSKIIGDKGSEIIKKDKVFNKTKFFSDSKLNYTENILKKKSDKLAINFLSEKGFEENITWNELYEKVCKFSSYLKKLNLQKGDRVAAYVPNKIESIICFLACAKNGIIWSSCSPDFGAQGVVDRFKQIEPKVFITCDYYYYNGKKINILDKVEEILKQIPSIKKVIAFNYNKQERESLKNFINFEETLKNDLDEVFERFEFNHPIYILFSSGTTGKPKCITHGSGNVLIEHNKEFMLHCDIRENEKLFYYTTTGWMMWNWLVSALASEASIVLFDGFPMHKNKDLLFKIAEKEKISLLGVSAKFIDQLKKLKLNIKSKFKLKYLKTICSTGSPLSSEGFEYIYRNVKKNVHLSSISGGTDIVSCFVLGNIFSPVFSGEIQNNGLGMDVDVFSERGESILNQKGELVCKSPFPSMPNKFWNDPGGKKYQSAYFLKYKNIWYHGDYAERKKNGGYIIYGRSDATLNPGGVRLGTAEIYSVIENFKEVKESIVVGQKWDNDIRIILFVVMSKSYSLNDDIILRLKKRIRSEASPRHVPSKIIQVSDIPRTKNGKIVELAVKNTIEGSKIKNVQALANPKVLNEFKNLKQLKF